MARLEDLITNVEDVALRDALSHEVKTLKQQTRFGLVFERQLPGSVFFPASAGLHTGERHERRSSAKSKVLSPARGSGTG